MYTCHLLSTLKFVHGKNISILKLRMAYFEIDVVRESILIQINIPRFDFGEKKGTKFYCNMYVLRLSHACLFSHNTISDCNILQTTLKRQLRDN